jgi:phage-related protein
LEFERNIVAYKRYFLDFYHSQPTDVQDKIEKVLNLVRHLRNVPKRFFEHIEDTKGLYEIKVEYNGNIYRIFSFFDRGNLIILGNAFVKKTAKTPKTQIEIALRIMKEYKNENK